MKSISLDKSLANKLAWGLTILSALLFAALSLVNHACFRTYSLDLGLYTHALYDYAHLQGSNTSLFLPTAQSLLSDHFDLYLILFSPLVWLFGTYTLLVVQIVAVLLGGWGIYKYIFEILDLRLETCGTDSPFHLPLAAMASFFAFFGIWQALAFDYHSNVVAAMLLPWLLYCIRRHRFGWATALVVLIAVAKENMSLWLFFVALSLMWDYRKDRPALRWLVGYALFSALYFVLVSMVVMPALGGSGNGFWRYAYMGNSYSEVALYLLSHPWEGICLFFQNITDNPANDGLKLECYLCLLISGGLLACGKPNYLVMLIPLLAQKMLAADPLFWGVTYQYNVEFAPVLVIAAFVAIAQCKSPRWRMALSVVALVGMLGTTYYTSASPKSWVDSSRIRLYDHHHYHQNDFDTRYFRQLAAQVPEDASLCASSCFVPHLALRDSIYEFPNGLQHYAQYYLVKVHYWLNSPDAEAQAEAMIADTLHFRVLNTDNDLYLLKLIKEPECNLP